MGGYSIIPPMGPPGPLHVIPRGRGSTCASHFPKIQMYGKRKRPGNFKRSFGRKTAGFKKRRTTFSRKRRVGGFRRGGAKGKLTSTYRQRIGARRSFKAARKAGSRSFRPTGSSVAKAQQAFRNNQVVRHKSAALSVTKYDNGTKVSGSRLGLYLALIGHS